MSVIKVCSRARVLSAIANIACLGSAPWKHRIGRNSGEVPLQGFPGAYRYQFRRALNSSLQLRIKPLKRFYLLKGKQLVSTRRDVSEDKQALLAGVGDAIQITGTPKLRRGRSQHNSCAGRLALFSNCPRYLRAVGGQDNAKLSASTLADIHLSGHSFAVAKTFRLDPKPWGQWLNRKTPKAGSNACKPDASIAPNLARWFRAKGKSFRRGKANREILQGTAWRAFHFNRAGYLKRRSERQGDIF